MAAKIRVIRPGSSYWYRTAREKGLECRALIREGAPISEIWWAAFVAVHRANKLLAIHNRMMRIPNRIAKTYQCKPSRVIVYDSLATLPIIPPFSVIPEWAQKSTTVL